jgi:hypothetical protein
MYWPNPNVDSWLAVSTITAATLTSPYSAGAMKRVTTSVPIKPMALEPNPAEIDQTALRTV